MDVRLPDGTIIQNVPDGTSKADLVAKLQKNGMQVPSEWMQAQPAPEQAKPAADPVSRTEKLGMGVTDPIHGGAQLLTKMLPDVWTRLALCASLLLAAKKILLTA